MSKTLGATSTEIAGIISTASLEEIPDLIERYKADPRRSVQVAVERAFNRYQKELENKTRVEAMYAFEQELNEGGISIGIDEVGRGPLAGPLCVCATVLPIDPIIYGIDDSKKLTPAKRRELAKEIKTHALGIGISFAESEAIDALGMSACIRNCMYDAAEKTGYLKKADFVLIDGNAVHILENEKCIVSGDAKVASIAAASIVAKVTRDELMVDMDDEFPEYNFAKNKGYGSKEHIDAIKKYGLCKIHRRSFCTNFLETKHLF